MFVKLMTTFLQSLIFRPRRAGLPQTLVGSTTPHPTIAYGIFLREVEVALSSSSGGGGGEGGLKEALTLSPVTEVTTAGILPLSAAAATAAAVTTTTSATPAAAAATMETAMAATEAAAVAVAVVAAAAAAAVVALRVRGSVAAAKRSCSPAR